MGLRIHLTNPFRKESIECIHSPEILVSHTYSSHEDGTNIQLAHLKNFRRLALEIEVTDIFYHNMTAHALAL